MSNPYAPPKAAVQDVQPLAGLPLWLRVLRAIAVAGDAILGVFLLGTPFFVGPQGGLMAFVICLFALLLASAFALMSRAVNPPAFWGLMIVNGLLIAFLAFALLSQRGMPTQWVFVLLLPPLLNCVALTLLRNARR